MHSATATAGASGFRSAVRAVITNVPGTGRVQDIRAPEVSSSWRDVLIQFAMKGDPDTAANRVQPVLDAVSKTRAAYPGL